MRSDNWLKSREGQIAVASSAFFLAFLAVLALTGLSIASELLVMLAGAVLGVALAYLLTAFSSRWGRMVAFVLILSYFVLPFFDLLVLKPRGYGFFPETNTALGFLARGFEVGFFVTAVLSLLSPTSIRPRRGRSENEDRR